MSRWMELKDFAARCVALASAFDPDGVDVYFLNRPKVPNVKHPSQLDAVFAREPTDYCLTPLSARLHQILMENRQKLASGRAIIVIATDGEPKSQDGRDSVREFTSMIAYRHTFVGLPSPNLIPISIRACTNDENSIGYLDKIDNDPFLCVDVTDDYQSELAQIQSVLGRDFQYTLGDQTLKCLLASSDPWLDKIDEPRSLTTEEIKFHKQGLLPSQ